MRPPRIDQLAAEGTRLTNFNVEAQCTPSRSAIMTGRHPIRSGTHSIPIGGGLEGLTQWEVTIAESLSAAGYATAMFGKWHLGSEQGRLRYQSTTLRAPVDPHNFKYVALIPDSVASLREVKRERANAERIPTTHRAQDNA
jgi:arylsulfatase A-like enzyme